MPKYIAITHKARTNATAPCLLPNCRETREPGQVGKYCSRHRGNLKRYGHPEGRAIRRNRDYGEEYALVADYIDRHKDHPGIKAGCRFFSLWMDLASTDGNVPGKAEFRGLSDHGVEPLRVLVEVMAVWAMSQWHPTRLPSDDRLTFALARAALSLAPRPKRMSYARDKPRERTKDISTKTLRAIGTELRRRLAALFVGLMKGAAAEEKAEREMSLAMHTPFIVEGTDGEHSEH